MTPLKETLATWLAGAEAKAANGGVTRADLQTLRQMVEAAEPRQRLLYLHTRAPSVYAPVIGIAQHEPIAGHKDTLRTREGWPYETVQEALVAGWQVIHFPTMMAPYDDRELDYVGYEFILQKLEVIVNE